MKGKLFQSKPLPPKNEIIEYFAYSKKPWEKNPEKVYNWNSSIPQKWVALKGNGFFKHKSQIKHPRLSIELLQNSKKYLQDFQMPSQELTARVFPNLTPIKHRQSPQELPKRRASMFIPRRSPEKSLLITGESSPSIYATYRPNTVRDVRSSLQNNPKIEEFLKRFEKKNVVPEHAQENKGLLGWKLKHLKKNQKMDYCKIFNVKKQSDSPFSKFTKRRNHSVD